MTTATFIRGRRAALLLLVVSDGLVPAQQHLPKPLGNQQLAVLSRSVSLVNDNLLTIFTSLLSRIAAAGGLHRPLDSQ